MKTSLHDSQLSEFSIFCWPEPSRNSLFERTISSSLAKSKYKVLSLLLCAMVWLFLGGGVHASSAPPALLTYSGGPNSVNVANGTTETVDYVLPAIECISGNVTLSLLLDGDFDDAPLFQDEYLDVTPILDGTSLGTTRIESNFLQVCNNVPELYTISLSAAAFACLETGKILEVELEAGDDVFNCGDNVTVSLGFNYETPENPVAMTADPGTLSVHGDCEVGVAATDIESGSTDNCTANADLTKLISTDSISANAMSAITLIEGTDFDLPACPASKRVYLHVIDDCGNEDITGIDLMITDSAPPVWDFDCELTATYRTSEGDPCPNDATISLAVGDEISPTDNWTLGSITVANLSGCVEDNCTAEDDLTIRVTALTDDLGSCTRNVSITFEAEDECGNTAGGFTCDYVIIDDTGPEITTQPSDETVECDGAGNTADLMSWLNSNGGAVANDTCQSSVSWSYSPDPATLSDLCGETGAVTVTFTADDGCGNTTATNSATFTIEDTEGPVWQTNQDGLQTYRTSTGGPCPSAGSTGLAIGHVVSWNVPFATNPVWSLLMTPDIVSDNCTANSDLEFTVDNLVITDLPNDGTGAICQRTISITLKATDDCDNASMDDPLTPDVNEALRTFNVVLIDDIPPTALADDFLHTVNDANPSCSPTISASSFDDGSSDGCDNTPLVFEISADLGLNYFTSITFLNTDTPDPAIPTQFNMATCPAVFPLKFRVKDHCGNISEVKDVQLTIDDDVDPVAIGAQPNDPNTGEPLFYVDAGCEVTIVADSLDNNSTDNCTGPDQLDFEFRVGTNGQWFDQRGFEHWFNDGFFDPAGPGRYEYDFSQGCPTIKGVQLRVTDQCNNRDIFPGPGQTFDIAITDTIPPAFTTLQGPIVVDALLNNCFNQVAIPVPGRLDNCFDVIDLLDPTTMFPVLEADNGVNVLNAVVTLDAQGAGLEWQLDFPVGTTNVTYTITDHCGNETAHTFTVTVNPIDLDNEVCPVDFTHGTSTDDVLVGSAPSNSLGTPVDSSGDCEADVAWYNPAIFADCNVDSLVIEFFPGSSDCPADAVPAKIVHLNALRYGGFYDLETFGLGSTRILSTSYFSGGSSQVCDFEITVYDDEVPTITCENPDTGSALELLTSAGADCPQTATVDLGPATWDASTLNGSEVIQVAGMDVSIPQPGDGSTAGTFLDNCPDDLTLSATYEDVTTEADDCPRMFKITWTVTDKDQAAVDEADGDGLSASCDQYIRVKDDEDPFLLPSAPALGSVFADNDICAVLADITAIRTIAQDSTDIQAAYDDNCTTDLIISDPIENFTGDDCNWTLTRMFDVRDECDNAIAVTIIHEGGDQTDPLGTPPTGVSGLDACPTQADAITALANAGVDDVASIEAHYSDNCGEEVVVTGPSDQFVANPDGCSWSLTRTYLVRDECGNPTDGIAVPITHSGSDQTPPELTGTEPAGQDDLDLCADEAAIISAVESTDIANLAAAFSDACGGDLTVSLLGGSFAVVDPDDCSWTYVADYSIADACGNEYINGDGNPYLSITHTGGDETSPTGTAPDGQTEQDACAIASEIEGLQFPDNSDPSNPTTISLVDLDIANIKAAYNDACGGDITVTYVEGTLDGDDCGWTYTIDYTVEDKCGNLVTDGVSITHDGSDQDGPTVVAQDFTYEVDTNCLATIDANDLDNGSFDDCPHIAPDALTYLISEDGTPGTGLATIDKVLADALCSEEFTFYLHVIDKCGNESVGDPVTVILQDTTPPEITCPAPESFSASASCDLSNYNLTPATVVDCKDHEYTSITLEDPSGMVTNVALNSPFTDNISLSLGTSTICYTIKDECDNVAISTTETGPNGEQVSCCYTVTVIDSGGGDTPPTIDNCQADDTFVTSNNGIGDCTADVDWALPQIDDNCPGVALIYTITCTTPAPNSQVITYFVDTDPATTDNPLNSPADLTAGVYEFVYQAEDADGETSETCEFTITVIDDEAPTLVCAADQDLVTSNTEVTECPQVATVDLGPGSWDITQLPATFTVAGKSFDVPNLSATNPTTAPGTFSDNCPDNLLLTAVSTDVSADPDNCPRVFEITWTLNDSNPVNTQTCTQTFTISDNEDPVVNTAAADQTVECDGAGNTAALNAWLDSYGGADITDNCINLTYTDDFTGLSDDCGATGSATVTFTATDDCGNSVSTTATFTIEDTNGPDINPVAQNLTVQCDGSGNTTALNNWLNSNGGASATDVCTNDALIVWTNNFTGLSDDCGATGSATVTFTATDECGQSSTTIATFTIEDTSPPSIVGGDNMTVECDGSGNGADLSAWLASNAGATATDVCGGVTWSNDFDALSDLCGATGAATVQFTASDECGLTSSVSFTFTIEDTLAPTIDPVAADQTVECDGDGNTGDLSAWLSSNGGASASDDCGGVTWSNDFTSLSDDCGATGSATVTFTATDECGWTSTTTATFTIEDTTDPDIDPEASDLTVECDGAGNLADLNGWLSSNGGASATDDCGGVTWSNDFDALSDLCGETGAATVTFTATDECGRTSEATATFTIEDTTGPELDDWTDPELTAVSTDCNQFFEIPVPAIFDVCAPNDVYSVDDPSNVSTVNLGSFSNGVVPILNAGGDAWETNYPVGTTTGSYTAYDDCGNSTTIAITITVYPPPPPQPPVCPGNFDVGTSYSASIQGSNISIGTNTDDCEAEVAWMNPVVTNSCNQVSLDVIFTATTAPSAPPNITYGGGAALGGFPEISTFQLGCTTVSIVSTFTGGTTEICSFEVCVSDDENPLADCTAASDLELECGPTNAADIATWLSNAEAALLAAATDNCGPLTIDNDYDNDAQRECVDNFGLANGTMVTFTISDDADPANTAICTKTIKIIDTLPPTIDTAAADDSAECDGSNDPGGALSAWLASNGGAAASDQCGTVTWSNDFAGLSDDCGATGSATVTFTATDECQRTASTTATFTVLDTTSPSIDSPAADGSAECDGAGNVADIQAWVDSNGGAAASDDCGSVIWSNDYVAGSLSDGCGATGSVTVIFTATDECGLTNTTSGTFNVTDSIAPSIDTDASDSGAECDGAGNTAELNAWLASNGGAAASDDCGSVTWSNDFTSLSDDCGATGSATVTFTATDECGLASTTSATFTITDTTAPVITCSSAVVTAPLDANGSVTVSLDAATGDILVDGAPSGVTISIDDTCGDASFNAASATFGCVDKGDQNTLTITGFDECNNATTTDCVIAIDVVDQIAPTFTSTLPTDVNMLSVSTDCNENDNYPIPTAEDNCPGDEPSFCSNAATAAEAFCTTTTGFTICVTTTDVAVNSSINELAGEFLMDFPVGLTTVTFTVYDASCNPTSHSFDVVVQDQLVPFISLSVPCPQDAVLDNDPGLCEAEYTWQNPEFQDNCEVDLVEMYFDGVLQNSWMDAPPMDGQNDANGQMQTYSFPVGTTTVTYNYFDGSVPPNMSVCEFAVTVNDTEAPVLDCSAINGNRSADAGVCSFTMPGIGFDPTWTDNCEFGGTTLTNDFNNTASLAGETFPVGTTTVIWTVTDPNGNSDTCTISIIVTDDEDPVITCPGNITQTADVGACGALIDYTVGESDNCGATLTQTAGLASGSLFPVGTTTNSFTLTDAAGNSVTCSFDVTITDDEDPTISCPDDVSQGVDAGVCGAVINYAVTSSDNCPGESITQTAGLASGSVFPVGTTTNTFVVTDASGNTATCSFDVTIVDDENPVAVCADIDVFLDADGNATITPADVDGGSTDNCGVPSLAIDLSAFDCNNLGAGVPGTATVNLTATDGAGNTDSCAATVTIIDNLPPVLTGCQGDVTIPALTGTCQNQFDWNHPTATDNCDGPMLPNVPGTDNPAVYFAVTTDDPSVLVQFESTGCEALFPVGTTTVTHTYTDAQGNVGSCSFIVTVTGGGAGSSPTAGFTSVVTDMMVAFTDASANATSWSWDFGDGVGSSTMQNPTYTYTTAGTYNVCLTVSNGCGEESTLCANVSPTVGNPIVEPDLTPTITAVPLSLIGISTVYYSVEVEEIQGGDTDGSDITVLIPVDPRLTFTWDPAMTASGFATVDNSNWTYTNLGAFHKFTTSNVILGGNSLKFGFEASYDPQGTTGNYTTTTFLQTGSGGETVTTNNGDAEGVTYFQ